MTATEAVTAPPSVADAGAEPQSRWSRWSDRLNPIVVREVQQALKGRAFLFSVMAAVIVVVAIALVVAGDFDARSSGRNAFDAGLATLAPLLLFVTPMGAYQSMRHELRAGMVEQLLLSELRPRRIITGKLAAAMVQFVLYVSVISPLLATSYLLRGGVDMPTVAVSLLLAALFCVVATAFAISSAAQGMLPSMQALASLAVAVGLAFASMGMIGYIGSGEYARDIAWLLRSSELPIVLSLLVLGSVASCVMSGLTASTFLAHAYENKSTGFRVFLLAAAAVTFGWIWAFVDAAQRDEVIAAGTVALMIGGSAFAIFMVTEQAELSPRVEAHVPKGGLAAVLAAPFLPGRHRGLLCYLLFCGVLAAVALATWPAGGRAFLFEARRFALFVFAYAGIYLSLAMWLRGRLPASVQGNHLARAAVPFLVFVFCILPVLVDVFARGRVSQWHFGHIMNPFWTIIRHAFRSSGDEVLLIVTGIAAVMLLLHVPGMVAGVREVRRAAARRRRYDRERAEAAGAA